MFLVGCFWLHPQIPGDWTCDHAPVCHVGKVRATLIVGRWKGASHAGGSQETVVARVRAAITSSQRKQHLLGLTELESEGSPE